MDADFSVELGPPTEEATLELPWNSGTADGPRYFDLKRHPELLSLVPEAEQHPEVRQFLGAINSPESIFETAKCDVWVSHDLSEAEQIYAAECKMGSYVDLVFDQQEREARFSFFRQEELARSLVRSLQDVSEIAASIEFIVRRCYYHEASPSEGEGATDVRSGFYLTIYVFGYGQDDAEARQNWGAALELTAGAILQASGSSKDR